MFRLRCDPPGSRTVTLREKWTSIFSNPYLFRWLAMGVLVLLVAFFATSETSLFALSPLDRLRLKEQHPTRGGGGSHPVPAPASAGDSAHRGGDLQHLVFGPGYLHGLKPWGPRGEWLVLLVMVPTFQFLGEIIAKSLALAYPAAFAGPALLIRPAIFILSPFRVVFLQISRGLLVALGFRPDLPVHSVQQEDFVRMVEDSHRRGLIAAMERDFIQNLLNFGELRVGQIMVPRTRHVHPPRGAAFPGDDPGHQTLPVLPGRRFMRIILYHHVLGVLHAKDILELCHQDPGPGPDAPASPSPGLLCPANKRAFDLLNELQAQHQRQALVVDEYGTLVGLVTVEDLLEELCGEIPQEFVEEEEVLEEVSPGRLAGQGGRLPGGF